MIIGQSKPISDSEQRGDQFGESKPTDIESGQGGDAVSKVGAGNWFAACSGCDNTASTCT